MQILVTGATGFVGRNLVPALLDDGHEIRALTRARSSTESMLDPRVEVREGDLLEPETIEGVFADVDVAYYLVHSLGYGKEFATVDHRAASNFAAAASAAGVARVIYLGGLGETGSDLSEHLRSRREVEAILAEGAYELTTFRAAVIIGAGSGSFEMIRQLVGRLPVMITPRWVRTPVQPIAIRDVVAYLRGALAVPETAGRTLEIGGPEVLTYEEMLRRTASAMGRRLFMIPIPALTPRLSVYWIDLVTDTPKRISHPLVEGLRNPVVVTDETAQRLLDVELTPFDEALARALAAPNGSSEGATESCE